jgi:hypothetical protein
MNGFMQAHGDTRNLQLGSAFVSYSPMEVGAHTRRRIERDAYEATRRKRFFPETIDLSRERERERERERASVFLPKSIHVARVHIRFARSDARRRKKTSCIRSLPSRRDIKASDR